LYDLVFGVHVIDNLQLADNCHR